MSRCNGCSLLPKLIEYLDGDIEDKTSPCNETCYIFIEMQAVVSGDFVAQHDALMDGQLIDVGLFGRAEPLGKDATIEELRKLIRSQLDISDMESATFLVMHTVLGVSYREIARLTGIPRTTVMRKSDRAVKRKCE